MKSLLLCRTPFQALIMQSVMRKESISSYDLLYFTQDNSEEDIVSYKELQVEACNSIYVYVKKKPYDIINHVSAYISAFNLLKKDVYDLIFLSSFDNLVFRKFIAKNKKAKILTCDDGLGNIIQNSIFTRKVEGSRSELYEKIFGIPSKKDVMRSVIGHYTVYRDFENIFPAEVLRYVDVFDWNGRKDEIYNEKVSFFIGQPFHEYVDEAYVKKVLLCIKSMKMDWYVKHAREIAIIDEDIPILKKNGEIAEKAIINACNGKRPVIYGGFSAVMFNVPASIADKVMLLRCSIVFL